MSDCNIKPLADYVVVREIKSDKVTSTGIHLMSEQSKGFKKAEILAVNDACELEIGSIVMIKEWAGFPVEDSSEKLLLVAEEDILAVVEEA